MPLTRPLLLVLALLAGAGGCARYQFGVQSLYRNDIRTVYVPIFESESFRPGMGERLTEAVVKEIEGRSTYKVVGPDRADSILSGRIISETKRVITEDADDDPRDLDVNLVVQISWGDRRGNLLTPNAAPLAPLLVEIGQNAHFVPEAGQSISTAHQQAIQRMAKQIVDQMETPW